jgi:hypothetical protein
MKNPYILLLKKGGSVNHEMVWEGDYPLSIETLKRISMTKEPFAKIQSSHSGESRNPVFSMHSGPRLLPGVTRLETFARTSKVFKFTFDINALESYYF